MATRPERSTRTKVVVSADAAAPTTPQIDQFAGKLGKAPGVGQVASARTSDNGRVTEIDLLASSDPFGSAAFRTVHAVQTVAHSPAVTARRTRTSRHANHW